MIDPNQQITYEWLRSRGFKIDGRGNDSSVHVSRELPDRERCLEIAPSQQGSWHCWLNDELGSWAKFLHLRTLTTREQLEALWMALTDKPLDAQKYDAEKFAIALDNERAYALVRYRQCCDGDRFSHR